MQFSEKIRLEKNNFLLLIVLHSVTGEHHVYLEITGANYKRLQQLHQDGKDVVIAEFGKIILQGRGSMPTETEKYFIRKKYNLAE